MITYSPKTAFEKFNASEIQINQIDQLITSLHPFTPRKQTIYHNMDGSPNAKLYILQSSKWGSPVLHWPYPLLKRQTLDESSLVHSLSRQPIQINRKPRHYKLNNQNISHISPYTITDKTTDPKPEARELIPTYKKEGERLC